MGPWRLPDRLWAVPEPLLPARPPRPRGGRPPVPARRAMEAIWCVMRTGRPRRALNATTLRSSATAERRFRERKRVGAFERLHRATSDAAHASGAIDRAFLAVDGCHEGAPVANAKGGPSRLDRREQGSKRAAIVDRGGPVLAVAGGDRRDPPPAREALTVLRVPSDARPGVFAANGASDDTLLRAGVAALGFTPDVPRNPRRTGRPKHRGFVPGRWWSSAPTPASAPPAPRAPAGPARSTATKPPSPQPPRTASSGRRSCDGRRSFKTYKVRSAAPKR
jgi:putative transposase